MFARNLTAKRPFSLSSITRNTDLIKNLYLKQLKSYVPPSPKPATDLSYKINTPQPPPQPTLLSSDANVESVLAVDKAEVDQWEPLVDPIDDPKNFVQEWDFESDRDEGYYPKRLVAPEYH